MNFIKLGKRYINLDAIAATVPRKKGLGYTVNFIGGTQMDICEMDMADFRRVLELASTKQITINETNDLSEEKEILGPPLLEMFESYHNNKGTTHER
ncbi:MAG: hypothetical protein J6U57_10525 [Bacteroidales bacterium]|nr:hypothetical protein [Bacteroidales bacterium]